jgi:hypothetical protein
VAADLLDIAAIDLTAARPAKVSASSAQTSLFDQYK